MSHWISRDIATLLKEASDPITYGRLLRVAKVFGAPKNVSLLRRKRKLRELLETLPNGMRPCKPRTAYLFFSKERRVELKKELPDLKATEVMRQLGQDWRRIKATPEADRFQAMAAQDKVRYQSEKNLETWTKLVLRRKDAQQALAAIDEDALIKEASKVRSQKRRRADRDVWHQVGGQWPGRSYYDRVRTEVYKKRKVPKPGRSAYNFYMKDINATVRRETPRLPGEFGHQHSGRVMREIGVRWKSLTPEQRKPYEELARQDALEKAREALEMDD